MAIVQKLSDCYSETHLNYDLIFKVWQKQIVTVGASALFHIIHVIGRSYSNVEITDGGIVTW